MWRLYFEPPVYPLVRFLEALFTSITEKLSNHNVSVVWSRMQGCEQGLVDMYDEGLPLKQ